MVDNEVKKEFITIPEAIEEFGNSREWWSERLQDGRIKGKKNGEWKMVRQSAVDYLSGKEYQDATAGEAAIPINPELAKVQDEIAITRAKRELDAEQHGKTAEELKEWQITLAEIQEAIEKDKEANREKERALNERERVANDKVSYSEELSKKAEVVMEKAEKRHEDLTVIEKMKLAERDKYTSLLERQRKVMPTYLRLMSQVANIILGIKGFGVMKTGDKIWDDLEQIEELQKADFDKNAPQLLELMKANIMRANQVAVDMSRIIEKNEPGLLGKLLGKKEDIVNINRRDDIVDKLERIVLIFRDLKPAAWCPLMGNDEEILEGIETFMQKSGGVRVSADDLVAHLHTDIDTIEYILNLEKHKFYRIQDDKVVGHICGLVANRDKITAR